MTKVSNGLLIAVIKIIYAIISITCFCTMQGISTKLPIGIPAIWLAAQWPVSHHGYGILNAKIIIY